MIVGVAAGVAVFLLIIVAIVLFVVYRRRTARKAVAVSA